MRCSRRYHLIASPVDDSPPHWAHP